MEVSLPLLRNILENTSVRSVCQVCHRVGRFHAGVLSVISDGSVAVSRSWITCIVLQTGLQVNMYPQPVICSLWCVHCDTNLWVLLAHLELPPCRPVTGPMAHVA